MVKALTLLVMAFFWGASWAEEPGRFYLGSGYTHGTIKTPGFSSESLSAMEVRLGLYLNENFSFELRSVQGQGDALVHSDTQSIDISLNSYQGIFLKPGFQMDRSQFFLLVGFYQSEFERAIRDSGTSAQTHQHDGFAVGIGFGSWYTDRIALNFEWKELVDSTLYKWMGATIGISIAL